MKTNMYGKSVLDKIEEIKEKYDRNVDTYRNARDKDDYSKLSEKDLKELGYYYDIGKFGDPDNINYHCIRDCHLDAMSKGCDLLVLKLELELENDLTIDKDEHFIKSDIVKHVRFYTEDCIDRKLYGDTMWYDHYWSFGSHGFSDMYQMINTPLLLDSIYSDMVDTIGQSRLIQEINIKNVSEGNHEEIDYIMNKTIGSYGNNPEEFLEELKEFLEELKVENMQYEDTKEEYKELEQEEMEM